MSEFRQYRLASQLFDRLNCLRDPKSCSGNLFSNNTTHKIDLERIILDLSQFSSEPAIFLNHARYIKENFPSQFSGLILFLYTFHSLRNPHRQISRKGTPMKKQPTSSTPLRSVETMQYDSEDKRPHFDLNDIAKRLESVSSKLGRPVSSNIPVPLESNDLDSDFPTIQLVRNDSIETITRYPLAVQELCIVEDLLFLFLNLNGNYFSYKEYSSTLKHTIFVNDRIDPSILNRLKPVLKAAYCASRLNEFIFEKSKAKNGQVVQALAFALDSIVKEFFQVIMNLDKKFKSREIGLHQFCFHLVPFTRSLQSLLHLTFEIELNSIDGGALIRLLEEKITTVSGDRQLRTTYVSLMDVCSSPYLNILNRWLSTGSFSDPYSEFMIVDTKKSVNVNLSDEKYDEDFLSSRFVISSKNIPRLLEEMQQKILLIGLYRNIQCVLDKDIVLSMNSKLHWDRRLIHDAISNAYSDVNSTLMNSLFQSSKLFDAICAAKRFFFIQNSDLIQNFLNIAQSDLNRTRKEVTILHLKELFDVSAKNSCSNTDPFTEYFRLEFSNIGLYDGLVKIIQNTTDKTSNISTNPTSVPLTATQKIPKIIDILTLDMKIDFPESLIINSKVLAKYKIIFRHSLQCLDLIRGLSTPLNRFSAKYAQVRQFEVMKQSMLQFVRTMHYYICYNVLEPQWERFSSALKERRFSSVEEITNTHTDFLDTCLRECMLTNSKLVQLINMVWSTCSKYAALVHELNNRISAKTLTESTFQDVFSKFNVLHQHFLKYVRVLIEALQYYAARDCDHYIANFLSSLDCQFYFS